MQNNVICNVWQRSLLAKFFTILFYTNMNTYLIYIQYFVVNDLVKKLP